MGTWGTGIFADDTAEEVRDDWREALIEGLDPTDATARVLERHADALEDRDDAVVVWLALAAAQAATGRLLPDVRERALALIAAGADIARWQEEDSGLAKQRTQALERLRRKLIGPQRPPTRLRRPPVRTSSLSLGDVVRLRGDAGEALFVVVDVVSDPEGSTAPVVATLLWEGGPLPSRREMSELPLLLDRDGRSGLATVTNVVFAPQRGKLALRNFGEVVATGVARPDFDAGQARPYDDYASWQFLSLWVGEAWFRRCVELTRRETARPG